MDSSLLAVATLSLYALSEVSKFNLGYKFCTH